MQETTRLFSSRIQQTKLQDRNVLQFNEVAKPSRTFIAFLEIFDVLHFDFVKQQPPIIVPITVLMTNAAFVINSSCISQSRVIKTHFVHINVELLNKSMIDHIIMSDIC